VSIIFLYEIKSTLIFKNTLIEKQNKIIEYANYPIVSFEEIENSIELSQHINKQICENDNLDFDEEMGYYGMEGGASIGSVKRYMNWRDEERYKYNKSLEINLMAKNGKSFDELKEELQKNAGFNLRVRK
jgi:hypothetical protein